MPHDAVNASVQSTLLETVVVNIVHVQSAVTVLVDDPALLVISTNTRIRLLSGAAIM